MLLCVGHTGLQAFRSRCASGGAALWQGEPTHSGQSRRVSGEADHGWSERHLRVL